MKLLKRLLVLTTLIITTLSLTACNATQLNVGGNYWFKDTTAFSTNYEEVCVYDLSLVHVTPSNSTEVKTEGYTINVEQGYYKTTLLTVAGGNERYRYLTEFKLKGTYVTPENTLEFVDEFNSLTEFTRDFKPLKSNKTYNSTLTNYSYSYTVNYEGANAQCSLTEYPNVEGKETKTDFTLNNVLDGAYIDNDAILFMGRSFNVTSGFSQQFKSVDVLSKKAHDMAFHATHVDNKVDVKSFDAYTLNGELVSTEKIACNHLRLSIQDTYSGGAIETYYATDHKRDRHRLVETYTVLDLSVGSSSFTLGYIKYSLKSVTLEEN